MHKRNIKHELYKYIVYSFMRFISDVTNFAIN